MRLEIMKLLWAGCNGDGFLETCVTEGTAPGDGLRAGQTHVKSCRMTRAGLKGTSTLWLWVSFQLRMRSTSACFTRKPSQFLTADSSSTRMEKGSRAVGRQQLLSVPIPRPAQALLYFPNTPASGTLRETCYAFRNQ